MHAGRSCQLGQAADRGLNVILCNHHEVGQLINDDEDRWHVMQSGVVEPFSCLSIDQSVIPLDVTNADVRKQAEALLHLGDAPVQSGRRLLGVRDNGKQKVRDPVVDGELDDLRVDHDQFYILGTSMVDHAHDDRVDADRLAGSRGTCNQDVRHLRDVRNYAFARNILADTEDRVALVLLKLRGIDDLPERYHMGNGVRHLDADRALSRDGCLDTDVRRRKGKLDVVCKTHDLAHLDALLGDHLITRHRRSLGNIRDLHADTEGLQRILQLHRRLPKLLGGVVPVVGDGLL